jgi:hypothetical protein
MFLYRDWLGNELQFLFLASDLETYTASLGCSTKRKALVQILMGCLRTRHSCGLLLVELIDRSTR